MHVMQTRTIHEESELSSIANEVLASLVPKETAHTLALTGDLGVGKTAFTKALARVLGVQNEITSPTFVIMKTYPIPQHPFLKHLTHIDAYRIESDDEMRILGFEELISDPSRLIVIEWPERIQSVIPADAGTISLAIVNGNERTITYGS